MKRRQAKVLLDDDYDNEEVEIKTNNSTVKMLGVEKPHEEHLIVTSNKNIPP